MKLTKEQKILVFLGPTLGALYCVFYIGLHARLQKFLPPEHWPGFDLIHFVYPVAVLAVFLIVSLGIFHRKIWAFKWYPFPAILMLLGSKPILLMSYQDLLGIIGLFLYLSFYFIVWLVSRKSIKAQFGLAEALHRKTKIRALRSFAGNAFIAALILLVASYAFFYFIHYPKNTISYDRKAIAEPTLNYAKRDVFSFSLLVPSDMKISSFRKVDYIDAGYYITMDSERSSILMGVNFTPLNLLYKIFGYSNLYEFHRRVHRPARFLAQVFSARFGQGQISFREIKASETWKGFLMVSPQHDGEKFYWYDLYHKEDKNIFLSIGFKAVGHFESERTISEILSSLEKVTGDLRSAEEYFQQGLSLYNQQEYEEAKFNFVNAVFQDPKNTQYRYFLELAFSKTDPEGENGSDH